MKKFCDSFFVLIKRSYVRKCGKLSGFLRFRVHKTTPCPKSSACPSGFLFCFELCDPNFRKMRFQTTVFPLHPELFQVKCHCEEEKFCSDIFLPPGEETTKSKVCLEQSKSTLHLNRAAHTQIDPAIRGDIILRLSTLFPEGLFQNYLFRLIRIFCLAAGAASGTVLTILAAVMSSSDKVPILPFCIFSPKRQLSAFCADKTIFFGIVDHILNAPNLLLELFGFLCFVVGGLNKAELPVFF